MAGEIFRSDISGDGTVGDLLTGAILGSTGKYSTSKLTQAIAYYDNNVAGKLTPAGQALVNSGLFTQSQLHALGAYAPLIHGLPEHAATATWLKTMDLRLSRPFQVSERVKLEPNLSVFNLFNWANYGGAGNQLSGVMDGAPGTSLNNSSSARHTAAHPLHSAPRGWTAFWPVRVRMRTALRGKSSWVCGLLFNKINPARDRGKSRVWCQSKREFSAACQCS